MSISAVFKKSFLFLVLLVCSFSVLHAEEEEGTGEPVVSGSTAYLQLKPTITTNYMSPNLKYVRADVAIRVGSGMLSNIGAHMDPVRDILIMLLARQDKETLTSSEGVAALREEAKEEIIAFLESEGEPTDVIEVLFMSFLVE